MSNVILTDVYGDKLKANILFTHFDYNFGKDYIVYLVDDDVLASSYEIVNNEYIIDNDLSSKEYDMIDHLLATKLGGAYA